jgi:hypothetical protein
MSIKDFFITPPIIGRIAAGQTRFSFTGKAMAPPEFRLTLRARKTAPQLLDIARNGTGIFSEIGRLAW